MEQLLLYKLHGNTIYSVQLSALTSRFRGNYNSVCKKHFKLSSNPFVVDSVVLLAARHSFFPLPITPIQNQVNVAAAISPSHSTRLHRPQLASLSCYKWDRVQNGFSSKHLTSFLTMLM
jgi:hypothetical protein